MAGDDDRAALDGLRGRLKERGLRVLVAGEAKRGKSTLINALLGRLVLPVGVTPLTALATTVRHGQDEGATAVFRDGRERAFPLSALDDLVTERGNPGNRRNLASVTVVTDAPVLARGMELVDRAADLRLSVTGHARRLAGRLADEVALARRAARMRTGEAAQRVEAFTARLAAVTGRGQDAADLAQAESKRMLTSMNEAAEHTAREATARVRAEITALLAGELRTAPAAETERRGRARPVELAVAEAEAWRQQQAEKLEQGLAAADERLTAGLEAELDAVRDAAAELLGLTLTVPAPGERLAPDLRFFYLTAEQAGQTELLAGAIRRWLPGEAGRRRARAWLHRQTAGLVPQQIGRARADLQYRLAEATRKLVRAIDARYAESTGRLQNALRTAATAREATAEDAARIDRELAARQETLGHVIGPLDKAVATHASGH